MDGFDISTLFENVDDTEMHSCSPCLICGEAVEIYEELRPAVPMICEECKRAVAWARKKMPRKPEGGGNPPGADERG